MTRLALHYTGYCLNGQCTDSFCGYYGLTYCGTQSANPCRQQCIAGGACNTMAGYTDSSTGMYSTHTLLFCSDIHIIADTHVVVVNDNNTIGQPLPTGIV